jgi:hypothetical protein
MHLHAHTLKMYGMPPPAVCTNDQEIVFPAWDQRRPLTLAGGLKACPAPLNAPTTDEELMGETLGILRRYDIRAVTTGPLEQVDKWHTAAPDRIIPAIPFDDYEKRDPDAFRRLFNEGRFAVFAEISAQYNGEAHRMSHWNPISLWLKSYTSLLAFIWAKDLLAHRTYGLPSIVLG